MSLVLRFAAGSHKGLIREGNEDSGYAGPRLLAVADGMGGAAAGEVASSEALSSIISLDDSDPDADLLTLLNDAVQAANERLRVMVEQDPQLEGMGCTLTALLWTGERMGLVHVGDSRAYLLRDGSLSQITQDHTWVQRLVDEGRITAEEAETHPQRSLLMRALDGRGQVEPDLSIREVRAGDRYLICSDGLSGPVSHQTLEETLGSFYAPEPTIQELIQLALRGGGPDNITCIVADVLDVGPSDTLSGQFASTPVVVGAVAEGPHGTAVDNLIIDTPAGRAAGLGRQQPQAGAFGPPDAYPNAAGGFGPAEGYGEGYPEGYGEGYGEEYGQAHQEGYGHPQDGYDAARQAEGHPEGYGSAPGGPGGQYDAQGYRAVDHRSADQPKKRRGLRRAAIGVLALGLVGGALYAGYQWTQGQYYVGEHDGHVAVYQGLDQSLAGLDLSSVRQDFPDAALSDLPADQQSQLRSTVSAGSLDAATQRAKTYEAQATVCRKVKQPGTATTATSAAFETTPRTAPKAAASPATASPAPTAPPTAQSSPSTAPQTTPSPAAPTTPSGPPPLTPDEQQLAKNCS